MDKKQKQKYRDEGFFIDDFMKVGQLIQELGLGEDLKEKWDNLLPISDEVRT